VQAEPGKLFDKPFRWAPQYPYGTPDWDLILRAFVDAGCAMSNNGEDFFEDDATLVGAGIGAEFLFKRNFSARVDWGVALKDLPERGVDAGSNRFHLLFTVLY
jgi:hemolysin activation/secretion protein